MRSWTVRSGVLTMNCRLKYLKAGAGAKSVAYSRFKRAKTSRLLKSMRIRFTGPIPVMVETEFEAMLPNPIALEIIR